ncbi:MAG TPA: hypothetical protein VNH22_00095 [Blastocatellia bacterium]|nr:hypothetical protein [Blastocatellia bacterium]
MFCPGCSTQAIEGAKFCKVCGMNLGVISQAMTGGVVVSDPVRDREYKRARKQISEGIQGSAVGTALLTASSLAYYFLPRNNYVYILCLGLGLAGVIQLFRSIAGIIDAKVGPRLLDPALQPRPTGNLSSTAISSGAPVNVRASQRLPSEQPGLSRPNPPGTRPVSAGNEAHPGVATHPPQTETAHRPGTGRVNREHSSPLKGLDKDDLLSKLRN